MTSQNWNPQGDPNQPNQPYQPPAQNFPPAGAPQPGIPANPYQGQVPSPYQSATPGVLADWGTRALGGLVDYVAPSIVVWVLSMPFAPKYDYTTTAVVGGGILYTLISSVLPLAWMLFNSGWKQGTTGQTFGKQLAKTKLISEETGQPVGFGLAVVRQIAHVVDSVICGIGYLFPLWDAKKQTLADKIMKTVVVKI